MSEKTEISDYLANLYMKILIIDLEKIIYFLTSLFCNFIVNVREKLLNIH